jgi:FKBP-type peptidyl-prolyl cis-trans isomerase FkpA
MKKIIFCLCLFTAALTVYGKGIAEEVNLADERAKTSLAFGIVIGSDLKQTGLQFDYAAFAEGLRLSVENGEAPYTMEEAIGIVQAAFQEAMNRQNEEHKQQELQFLAENSGRDGVISTESGLQYEVIAEGSGEKPRETDTVRVHYEGALADGTIFDSSYERDESAEIPLDQVIPGWSEGIQLMNTGGTYRFYIPSALAYGEQGVGQVIPPYATLVFKVELLEIIREAVEEPAAEDDAVYDDTTDDAAYDDAVYGDTTDDATAYDDAGDAAAGE